MDLATYRLRMEEFSEALSREYYEGRAGLKKEVSFAAIYEAVCCQVHSHYSLE